MSEKINQDLLEKVSGAVIGVISSRSDLNVKEVHLNQNTKELVSGNIYLLGHVLMDIHEILELDVDYPPLSEFKLFETVEEIIHYFYNKLSE